MELSQRFRKQLEQINLYNSNNRVDTSIEIPEVEQIKKSVSTENILKEENSNYKLSETQCNPTYTIENLKSELVGKIENTPYWEEYSSTRQENMISSYITTSLKKDRYSNLNCRDEERKILIKSIINLIRNK